MIPVRIEVEGVPWAGGGGANYFGKVIVGESQVHLPIQADVCGSTVEEAHRKTEAAFAAALSEAFAHPRNPALHP